jgi:hypothetical protein
MNTTKTDLIVEGGYLFLGTRLKRLTAVLRNLEARVPSL